VIPELQTERLRMRSLCIDDLDAYTRMYADQEVMRFLEQGTPLGRDAAFRSMAVHLGHWQLRGYGQWALEERASRRFVGRAGLWQPEGWPGLEVGWVLVREAWGMGYATEAGQAALDYAFDVLQADEVISLIRPENVGSIRVAERLGETYQRDVELLGEPARVYARARPRGDEPADQRAQVL
jgi:RimJ/RimL family protein N-acetyltransferase